MPLISTAGGAQQDLFVGGAVGPLRFGPPTWAIASEQDAR